MAAERKRKRGTWGYRFSQAGRCYKSYGFPTRAEAKEAEIQFRANLKDNPPLPPTALINVISAYLIDSVERGHSEWRVEGLRLSLRKHVLPYFGDAKLITDIEFEEIEKLVIKLKRSGALKPKSIWHVVANLRSTLNFAIAKKLLRENPIDRFTSRQLKEIVGSTRSVKPPMDMPAFDKAAESIKNSVDRAWFDVARFTGMRKDECNRLQWKDINFDLAMVHIPGTKTEDSDAWLPLAPVALNTLKELLKQSDPDKCPWVFPGRSWQTKGKKVYGRSYMFERIEKRTGIHLKPKDLRDYFATQVSSLVSDPTVVMKLLRHTNMKTTTGYLRTVDNRMRNALQNLGASAGGESGGKKPPQTAPNDIQEQLAKLTNLLRIKGFYDNVENSSTWPRAALSSPFIPLAVPTLTCTMTAWGRPVTKK
jgi:integrase